MAKILSKKFQKPDAVFGLRQTRNIENLLNDNEKPGLELHDEEAPEGRQVHEILDLVTMAQPLNQRGDELLFPFLVLEAKSGSSDSDWNAIQMQTAFPIKTFLDAQNRLKVATGQQSKWESGPLVWFFANRGRDWRVSIAYIEYEQSKKRKRDGPNSIAYVSIGIVPSFLYTRLNSDDLTAPILHAESG